ncbi:MAG: GIY-YIG nuclease family protein [Bdellovibrionota bacterium]
MNDLWFVYMIQNDKGHLYTGITNHLIRRYRQHQNQHGAKYFRRSPAKELVYVTTVEGRSEASKLEHQIKSLRRFEKLQLIQEVQR